MTKIHQDLIAAQKWVYHPHGLAYSEPTMELESADYGAYIFELSHRMIRFRVAKITPTKIGQFVTLWKRKGREPIQPFDDADPIDFFVISVRKNNYFGQFIFPKSILVEKNIVSINGKGGKRAIRVYPPWDKTTSKQAQQTQKWQLDYFLAIPENQPIDSSRIQTLYGDTK